ncbi:glutamate-1-semialdehyde 2,1-aminomutase [Draconibacterium orientale]|uniref:Glutamate-1-semialdehyde 2,1-aminomutase n=1 Tax=Draconibacterium orientale TaxID=1168034 RepID=X5DEB9_9BACT|nr:aspartate aminotransferase family protein [Draconibacterium orientale]AHW58712.1 glutamate-1-semialdehyde 2,1-aminomutase [Draconibacterium orientale]SET09934.1 glutamate-1-semialdehyde 2,1-aminomutase [Draconibacterium orientale]
MAKKENSEEIYNKARQVISGGVSRNTVFRMPYPNYANSASGCYITDIDGTVRTDFANNMAALIHGHSFPPIVDAVIEQLKKGTAYTLASEIEVAFATHLIERVPSFERIRFMNSGTEAVMAMIKASRAFTGRPKIAKAEGAYHGTYDFAEVSQMADPSNWGKEDQPSSVPLAHGTPPCVAKDVVIYPYNNIERTLNILDKHAEDIACVIVDPVPHRVGLVPGNHDFIEALYAWTRKNEALLVFDEVVTFRVNYGGAQENYSVKPDLTSLGKIIGGGFPVGAVAGRADVMQVFDPHEKNLLLPYSGTFSANPITMTAGYQAMKYFDSEAVQQLNSLADIAVKQIREAIKLAGVPFSVTGAGSMFRIHLRPDPPTTYREAYQDKEGKKLVNELLDYMYYKENTLMINTFSCMLSTVMTQKEIDQLTEGLFRAFKALKPKIEKLNND